MLCIYLQSSHPFFAQKIQGLFKDFQGHISHFSRLHSGVQKKSLESMSFFSSSTSGEFFPEGLCVSSFSFAVLLKLFKLKVSTEIQGLSSTNCTFQDFQGVCKPCICTMVTRTLTCGKVTCISDPPKKKPKGLLPTHGLWDTKLEGGGHKFGMGNFGLFCN